MSLDFLFRLIVAKYMNMQRRSIGPKYMNMQGVNMSLDFLFRSKSIICKSVI